MNVGDQHAVVLLATAVVPAAALLFGRRCRPTGPRALGAVLGAVLAAAFGLGRGHLCGAGDPMAQYLVPGAAAASVILFLSSRVAARLLFLTLVMCAGHLCLQYEVLVHEAGWTGNPAWDLRGEESNERLWRDLTVELLAFAPGRYRSLPAGWLDESGLLEDAPVARHVSVEPVWHTWFTRLWRTTSRARRLWYPGGEPRTAAAHIEWRDA